LLEPLSKREQQVLRFVVQGYTDKQIATVVIITGCHVNQQLKNIY